MKDKRWLLLLCGVPLLGVVLVILFARTKESRYSGKPLSAWLADYTVQQALNWPRQNHPPDAAIRAIGTNCFPAIITRLKVRDSKAKRQLFRVSKALRLPLPILTQERAHTEALAALGALGYTAIPLVPALADSLEAMNFHHQAVAGYWLANLGSNAEAAIPAVLRILRDQNRQLQRNLAVSTLSAIGSRQQELVLPVLKECLTDSNSSVRLQATNELTREQWTEPAKPATPPDYARLNLLQLECGKDNEKVGAVYFFSAQPTMPSLVVPLLTSNLVSSNPRLVEVSANALGAYGSDAKESLPLLINLLPHPKKYVRIAASNAVARIQASELGNGSRKLTGKGSNHKHYIVPDSNPAIAF